MSFVKSPSSDVPHLVDNFLNDNMPPEINSLLEEEEIPSGNYLTPSASNSDPNMVHDSMMNTANMPLTQHGVTPSTNSMNFQEGGFSIGNLQSPMMVCILFSIDNRSILKYSNEEIGDLRQHGGFTYSGVTNFQDVVVKFLQI
ncbi:hypothetical protein Gohar_014320 [Gossypium harknessii]|uniref:Uncharacterized protein n=1 Tax=Gossypium harknessii TaxID=34285 RepID=A0A7J9H2X1_9ROSI|nr:hypothetical protein [Gossypium harknessii]